MLRYIVLAIHSCNINKNVGLFSSLLAYMKDR